MTDGDADNTPVWWVLLNNTSTVSGLTFFPPLIFPGSRQGVGKRLGGTVDPNWPKGYPML